MDASKLALGHCANESTCVYWFMIAVSFDIHLKTGLNSGLIETPVFDLEGAWKKLSAASGGILRRLARFVIAV
jgi:hypothetical protein